MDYFETISIFISFLALVISLITFKIASKALKISKQEWYYKEGKPVLSFSFLFKSKLELNDLKKGRYNSKNLPFDATLKISNTGLTSARITRMKITEKGDETFDLLKGEMKIPIFLLQNNETDIGLNLQIDSNRYSAEANVMDPKYSRDLQIYEAAKNALAKFNFSLEYEDETRSTYKVEFEYDSEKEAFNSTIPTQLSV